MDPAARESRIARGPRGEIRAMEKASGELDGFPVGVQNRGAVGASIDVLLKRHGCRRSDTRRQIIGNEINCSPAGDQRHTPRTAGIFSFFCHASLAVSKVVFITK